MRHLPDHRQPDVTGREPGDDYPGERHDAARELARRQSAPEPPRPTPPGSFLAPRRCKGCQNPIMGFAVGLRYCSHTCYHDYEEEL